MKVGSGRLGPSASISDHGAMKRNNQLRILRAIRTLGPVSRVRLQKETNLSWGTITTSTKELIEKEILKEVGSEVIVVDLGVEDIPFPAVRVLATGLQPLFHEGDMRLSQRFFDVPVRLGLRAEPPIRADVKIWPLCGYR